MKVFQKVNCVNCTCISLFFFMVFSFLLEMLPKDFASCFRTSPAALSAAFLHCNVASLLADVPCTGVVPTRLLPDPSLSIEEPTGDSRKPHAEVETVHPQKRDPTAGSSIMKYQH